MKQKRPAADLADPEDRISVLCALIKVIALADGPILALSAESLVMKELGKREEECGAELITSALLLLQSGLIESDGYRETDEATVHYMKADTTYRASSRLIQYANITQLLEDGDDEGDVA